MREKIKEIGVSELLVEGVDRFLYVLASSKTVPMHNIKNRKAVVEGSILKRIISLKKEYCFKRMIADNTLEFANSYLYFSIEKKSHFFVKVSGST